MKNILVISTLFLSVHVFSEELCSSWEKKEKREEFRIPEDLFTAEEAFEAIEFLENIESGKEETYTAGHVENAKLIVKGYKLKRDAEKSIQKNGGNKLTKEAVKFCEFISNEAVFSD